MPESTKVVDSWAMVAWIQDEPPRPLLSWLNVAETFYITGDHEIRQCAVVPVDWIGP